MDEAIKKSDLESLQKNLQKNLQEEIRASEVRLGVKIDAVDQRLTAKIGEVDERLDAKMDVGFGMVARQFVETEERLKRHADVHFDALREDIRKVAEGVLAVNERLDRHLQQNEAEHTRLERAFLAGEAALDTRVTALEKRAAG